jgi:hypothetical protein
MLEVFTAEQLRYSNGLLEVEVLGGVRLEGLDRMRVTLKLSLPESSVPPIRHNLDLYNDTQTDKLTRKTAERLEVGTSVVTATLSELTAALETYRLEQIKASQTEKVQAKPLTESERKAALAKLQAAKLMEQTMQDLQESGIQGEAENALILNIAMTSRKMSDPLSVICLARSGTGKSYLMERVALCIPDEDKREQTQFSGNSLYYFKRNEIKGKVFLIEDLDGAQEVMFPIRELQTKKRISKTVAHKGRDGKLQTITLVVEGPVSIISCTTKESLYEDNANRSILLYLDDSLEQDKRIMTYQKRQRAGLSLHEQEQAARERLQHMQRLLEPIKVINPYAPMIELPSTVMKPRRTLPMLLSFIEAITFYHQHQREMKADPATGEAYIESSPEDIRWGFRLMKDMLYRKSDELSGALRSFYDWLKSWSTNKRIDKFYGSEIRQDNPLHPRSVQRYLSELSEYGYISLTGGSKHKTGYQYSIEGLIPDSDMQTSIERHIDTVLRRIEAAQEPQSMSAAKDRNSKTVRQGATKPILSHPNEPQESISGQSDKKKPKQEKQ